MKAKKFNKGKSKTKGKKFDKGKPPLSWIPYESLDQVAQIFKFGATLYEKDNWKNGIEYNRLLSASLRHTYKFSDKINLDDESNLNHIAHAATNLIMLLWMIKNKPEMDDR